MRGLDAQRSDAVLLLDGALGTQFAGSGFDAERDLEGHADAWELLNATRPEQVRAVHESYLDAGSDLISTHTFLLDRQALARLGLERRQPELVRAALRAAREAVAAWTTEDRPRGVLGVMGPGLDLPSRDGRDAATVEADAATLAHLLDEGGADVLCLETTVDPVFVDAAARGVRSVTQRPLWISFAPDAGGILGGFELDELVSAAEAHRPALIGLNCGRGPAAAAATLEPLRARWSGPLGFWPSASEDGGPGDPLEFASVVADAVRRFDLRAAGGCCGSGPVHVRRLAAELGHAGPEDDWYADEWADDADMDEDE